MSLDTPVLVVGAGPVGMTLALCLARRGISSTVVEMRPAGALPDVKCNHISARSMELFRALGVVRDAEVLAEHGGTDEGHRFGVVELQATGFAALGQQTGCEDQELVFFAGREFHIDLFIKAD